MRVDLLGGRMLTTQLKITLWGLALVISQNVFAVDDRQKVSQVVQNYFDGTAQGKPELINQAFLPSLELQFVREGKLVRMPRDKYVSMFKSGTPHDRVGKIISIDITGDTAVVKAHVAMGEKLYTDYLLLLKLEQGWKVSNKIATSKR